MKNGVLILAGVLLILLSCEKEEKQVQPESTSAKYYELEALLMDPGDGSGTFEPVSSSRMISLYPNGTLTANGDLCQMDTTAVNTVNGTYSLNDSTLVVPGCDTLSFDLTDSTLIINYRCIEPCRAKYRKTILLFPQ